MWTTYPLRAKASVKIIIVFILSFLKVDQPDLLRFKKSNYITNFKYLSSIYFEVEKIIDLTFHSQIKLFFRLEIVGRGSETQLQVEFFIIFYF